MSDAASTGRQIVRKRQFLDANFFNGTAEELSARILALKSTLDADPSVDAEVSFEGEEDWQGICVSAVYSCLETDAEMAARLEREADREEAAKLRSIREAAAARARENARREIMSRGTA